MKPWLVLIAILTHASLSLSAQDVKQRYLDRIARLKSTSTESAAKLAYVIEVAEQKYCSQTSMYLSFRETYENTGSVPIFLYRGEKIGFKWRVKQVRGRMREGYETTIAPLFELGDLVKWGEEPKEDAFIFLKPGETVSSQTKGGIRLDINPQMRGDDDDGLRAGTYILELVSMTWYYSDEFIEPFFQKWRPKGVLWWQDARSEPVEFTVTKRPALSTCIP